MGLYKQMGIMTLIPLDIAICAGDKKNVMVVTST